MNIRKFARRTKQLGNYFFKVYRINFNKLFHREYIPNINENIYIETSSICNLSCKFCAYSKKLSPKVVMEYERFSDYINQAVDLGYDKFGLTPITGEIFMDKGVFEKFEFLENHPKVNEYSFFSNIILLDDSKIAELFNLKKLRILSVSLYGHDKNSFIAITQKNEEAYNRLISNLLNIEKNINKSQLRLEIGWRTEEHFDFYNNKPSSELVAIIRRIRKKYDIPVFINKKYNNWGGMISQDDLTGLSIRINKPNIVYKKGACSLIFYKLVVMADGRINACACRDANATLCIGDLNKESLRHILSLDNKKYIELIQNQQRGVFNPICTDCDMYRSIYISNPVYRYHKKQPMSLHQFYRVLKDRCNKQI